MVSFYLSREKHVEEVSSHIIIVRCKMSTSVQKNRLPAGVKDWPWGVAPTSRIAWFNQSDSPLRAAGAAAAAATGAGPAGMGTGAPARCCCCLAV